MSKKDAKKDKLKKELQRIREKAKERMNNLDEDDDDDDDVAPKKKKEKSEKEKAEHKKNVKTCLIGFLVASTLVIGFILIYGWYVTKHKGYDTSKDAIIAFMVALNDGDVDGMSKTLSFSSKNGQAKAYEYYNTMKDDKTQIDMYIEDIYTDITPDEEYLKLKSEATACENVYVEIPATYTTDQYIFYVVMKWNIKTIKTSGGWLIDSIDDDEAVVVNYIENPNAATGTDATPTDAETITPDGKIEKATEVSTEQ